MTSFSNYWDKIKGINETCQKGEMLFYRGVSDASYNFFPGIRFETNISEDEAYHNMFIEFPEEFDKREHLKNLVKMQHYGVPTRLLDFTCNPLIALFFAVEQDKGCKDGIVYILKTKKKDVLKYNSDKALMLSCLPLFTDEEKHEIKSFCEKHPGVITEQDIQYNDIMKRFLHEIKGEYPAFETAIVGKDLLNCFLVRANKDNERMKAQDGAFAVFGLDIDENERFLQSLVVDEFRIDNASKMELLKELDILGINSSKVYPGLEQTALHDRDKKLGWKNPWE